MKKTASATHSTGKICILRILRKKLCKKIYSFNTGNIKIGNINIGDNSSFQQNVYCSEKACSQVLRQGFPGDCLAGITGLKSTLKNRRK